MSSHPSGGLEWTRIDGFFAVAMRASVGGRRVGSVDGAAVVERSADGGSSFEPTTAGQQNLHNQTLSQFFDFVEARRARLDETKLALPPLLWIVLAIGAVLNALMLALVEVRKLRVHLIMSGIIAIFVGLLIFVTASMDHPYAGYVSITPEPFQNLIDQLMGGP